MPADRDFAPSLSQRVRGFGRRTGLHGFWHWWLSELGSLVPHTTRTAARRRRTRPVIVFDAGEATIWQAMARGSGLAMEPTAPIPLGADVAASTAAGRIALDSLARVAYGAAGGAPRVVIALPSRQTLRRTLTLPAALEENLTQALGYDLDRHTPFKADELYFDAAVVGRDPVRSEIKVDLAAARRGVVDQAVQHAESWGATVVAVVPEAPEAASSSRLNLLPQESRALSGGWQRWEIWAPAALLAAIVMVAVALPIWQKRDYVIALHRNADEARTQAAVSEGLRAELDRLVGDYNFALERKFGFPSSLQVLDEITKLLPDDTWLTQMELKTAARGKDAQRELLLRGESGNAGRLITLFEESKVFTQAAPRSPTTKIQPGPGEIFDLVAQLRPLPPPAPVALAASVTPAPPGSPAPQVIRPANPAPPDTPAPTTEKPVVSEPAGGASGPGRVESK